MAKNVGETDKTVRTATGAVAGLLSLGILANFVPLPAIASPVLGIVALAMLVTSYTGVCPMYSVLGVSTCPADAGR